VTIVEFVDDEIDVFVKFGKSDGHNFATTIFFVFLFIIIIVIVVVIWDR